MNFLFSQIWFSSQFQLEVDDEAERNESIKFSAGTGDGGVEGWWFWGGHSPSH